ncbi:MAG: peptidase S41 [Flammeovirgaceae bacterium]|nr:peptidase S41 [Flammeovirgaceae bacterium]MBE63239.1 peptidase S41 [Flammeovirgaceae bacterium]HCX20830.1 peptidase S41 [Cytophagales bacterium]|tara:strand:+ start:27098 stop:28123 length:1026 start_codon:yes stop_codon:yes gene_type:complete
MKKLVVLLLLSALWSCDDILLGEESANTPLANFESVWNEFDAKYGLFESKGIDWDSVYTVYRPQAERLSSDAELYSLLTEMLVGLNDSHVALLPTEESGFEFFQSGALGKLDSMTDFSLEIIKENYLTNHEFADPFFTYGILESNIGYIHIEGFSDLPKFLDEPMSDVLNALEGTDGIIVDVRGGYGGEDLAGQFLGGRFASSSQPYMKSRVRNGPNPNDFTSFETWNLIPTGDFQYTKPIVVLTHRFTISARETFCLAMKVLPQVTFIGDTTAGAFSNQINREMPNGWGYSLSIGQWVDANNQSYEGVGLVPDILIENEKEDLLNGVDEALERALDQLAL